MAQLRIRRGGRGTREGTDGDTGIVWVLRDRGCSLQVWSGTADELKDGHRVRRRAETLSRMFPGLRVEALLEAVRALFDSGTHEVVVEVGEAAEARATTLSRGRL